MIRAFLARISVGILTSLIFGVYHGQDNTAWCIGAAIVNFGPDEIDPLLSTNLAEVLEPNFFFKEEGYSSIGEWDLANVEDSFSVLLEGKVNTATSNLFVNYRGNSYLYEASSCWVEFDVDSDENQKLLITGEPVGAPENSSLTMGIPIGESTTMESDTQTLQEVGLKFIPKPYKPSLTPFPFR